MGLRYFAYFKLFDKFRQTLQNLCYKILQPFLLKGREGVRELNSFDVIWNLLQMYLTEKEKNSKKEEKTNEENGECKNLHSQD